MRKIDLIIVHCSATTSRMDWGVNEIRDLHVKQNGWADIGYHLVIRRDGTVEDGRPISKAGAHAVGYNAKSVGVCMIGGVEKDRGRLVAVNNFTEAQWVSLKTVLTNLLREFPDSSVIGHRDVQPMKECPSFSVKEKLRELGITPKRVWV